MIRVTADNLGKVIGANVRHGATLMSDELAQFFSLLKRGVNGVYHHVSREHLARYYDEFAFRYENRKASDGERAKLLVAKAECKRLTDKQPARISA